MRPAVRLRGAGGRPEQTAAGDHGKRSGRRFERHAHRRRHGLYQGRARHGQHHQFGGPFHAQGQTLQHAGRIVRGLRDRRTDTHLGRRREDHPQGGQRTRRGRRRGHGHAAQGQRDGRRGRGGHQGPRATGDEHRQYPRRPRPGRDLRPVERRAGPEHLRILGARHRHVRRQQRRARAHRRSGRQPQPDRPGRRGELLGAQGRRSDGRLWQPRRQRRGARDHQAGQGGTTQDHLPLELHHLRAAPPAQVRERHTVCRNGQRGGRGRRTEPDLRQHADGHHPLRTGPRPLSRHRLAGRDPQPHVVPAHAVRQRAGRRQRRTLLRQPGHVAGELGLQDPRRQQIQQGRRLRHL